MNINKDPLIEFTYKSREKSITHSFKLPKDASSDNYFYEFACFMRAIGFNMDNYEAYEDPFIGYYDD